MSTIKVYTDNLKENLERLSKMTREELNNIPEDEKEVLRLLSSFAALSNLQRSGFNIVLLDPIIKYNIPLEPPKDFISTLPEIAENVEKEFKKDPESFLEKRRQIGLNAANNVRSIFGAVGKL